MARDPDRLRAADGDGWLTDHIERLDRLAQGFGATAAGTTLLHADIRADQLLLTDEPGYLVDWAHACVGASFVIERSARPPPPGPPTGRDFQRRQASVLLDWLRRQL